MSTEDVSPSSFDQRNSSFYERTRLVTETDAYNNISRRPTTNSYHNTTSELRGSRPREKIYSISRHPTYSSSAVERPTTTHRSSWYDTSPSSDVISGSGHSSPIASRSNSVYTNIQSAVVQPSEPIDCNNSSSNNSNSSKNNNNNNHNNHKLKSSSSRSSAGGSVSPCGSGSGSGSSSGRIRSRDRDRDRGGGGGGSSSSSSAASSIVVTQQQPITTSEQQRDNNRERSNSCSCSSNLNNTTTSSHSCSNSSSSNTNNNHHHHQQQQPQQHHHPTPVDSIAVTATSAPTTALTATTTSRSRSLSRSPSSSYSSTNSISSNSHASSPVSINEHHHNHHTSSSASSHHHNNCGSVVGVAASSTSSRTKSGIAGTTPTSNSNPAVHSEDNRPLAIRVRNLPSRSSDTSLKDGLFHEYKKHGKVTWVKVVGQNAERYALVCFKKPDDVDKALEVSHDKLFFGCKIDVEPYQGYDVEDNEFRPYEAELDEYHPKSTRTLFIGNLEKDITGNELRKHFEYFGEIIEIDIKKQGMNAYAFCQYSDIISVVKAMRQMDGEHLGNNRIKLGFGKSMPTNCVWIDGVTEQVGENHIISQFGRYGTITKIVIDQKRSLALISYEQITFAQLAVKEMRGQRLVAGGRKLQIDFASRECQDAFYEKLDKAQQGGGGVANNNSSSSGSGSSRYNRYDLPPQSRSRASSFTRHGAISPSNNSCGSSSGVSPGVGSSTPTTGGTSTGTMSSGVSLLNSATPRGSRTRNPRHPDYEYPERRIRSYDEYSQGSGGASHDEDSYSGYSGSYQRADTPQSRLNSGCNATTPDAIDMLNNGRRRCDKSPSKSKVLQKERFLLLEQLEECPSSGDEVSPKKRMKFDHPTIHHNNHHHPLLNMHSESNTNNSLHPASIDSNCDVTSNSNNHCSGGVVPNDIHHTQPQVNHNHHLQHANNHRKLSTSSNNSSASGRRPSIDTCPTTNSNASPHHSTSHLPCKRRRVIYNNSVQSSSLSVGGSSTAGPNESGGPEYHHVSRGRGHQLHSHHSHEASGGESADGSRPGTPLCDELPDAPSEPRRLPTKSSSLETRTRPILTLPLPKFGIPFFQKHRTPAGTLSALASGPLSMTTANNNSSVNSSSINSSSMVSNSLLNSGDCGPSSHSSLYKQKQHHQQQQQQQHQHQQHSSLSTMRPRSLSSNSSDSEPMDDSGIAERIKFVDEMYEKWSVNKDHHHVQHYNMQPTTTQQPPKLLHHKLLEFDIKEVPSSDIAKSLLAKKSIFDDDLQRLANINKKDEEKAEMLPLPKPSIPNLGVTKVPVVGPNQPPLPPPSPVVQPPAAPPTTPYQRVTTSTNSSPMNSPQPSMSSPYNSPSGASGAFKGLQYPFPSHTPLSSHSVSPVSSSAPKIVEPQPQKVLSKSNSLPNDVAAAPPPPSNPKQLKHSSSVGSTATPTSSPVQPPQPCPKKSEKNPEKSSHKEKKASKDEEKKEKERKERERKEKEERERKEREERDQIERELKEQRERELKEQKERERELKEQKERERELKEQKEKEQREQRERELKEQKERERELKEQKEREREKEREQRERELKEQRERELKEQKEREQRERELKEQKEKEQREKEQREKRERELLEQKERELKEQREREQRERELKEQKEKEQRERELKEQKEKDKREKLEKSKSECKEEKRNHKANNSSAEPSNPNRNINKRRLSLIDLPLATTYENSKKIRRDSKESLKHNSKERKESSSSSNATPPIEKASSVEQNLLFQPVKVEENSNMAVPPVNRHRKDSGFEEKHARKHGSKERTPSSSASKHSKSDEEEAPATSSHHSHHKKNKSKKEKKSERVKNSSSCSDSERPKVPKTLSSDSDSDQSSKKKSSIFEPNEDSPQYVSMYDKVKARSCKNMQKQVDEKKKKDIFSQFKKFREKKKCRTNEFDSDSHPVTSSDDENSDSARKPFYNQRLTDLWDRESSEDEEIPHNLKKRNSLTSKRIESDSDSDADVLQQTVIHVPPVPMEPIDSEDDMKSSPPTPEPKPQSSHDFFDNNFSDSKEGSFDRQIFSPDSRKRHKKSKKRPKADLASPTAAEKFETTLLEKKSSAIEDIFDELKRGDTGNSVVPHDKKQKHKDRKEKKRHDPLLSKEERHRLKKLKKAKAAAEQEAKQRGQKFDNIFGPISDDEEISSFSETPKILSTPPAPYKQEPLTPKSHTVEENEENKQKCARDPTSHAERERLRKEKREKKRKEREKCKEQHALNSLQNTDNILPPPNKGDEENSVDMDEAGRALEAQLMEDTTADEETPGNLGDNFRLSDPDENSIEFRKEEKDGQSVSGGESGHKHKEDKPRRKKKRKKDRKHEPSLMSPPAGPYINIDVSTPISSKPSPSLPCLDDDVQLSTPTTKNSDLLQISPIPRDKMLLSPIPKTPTISAITPTSSANNSIDLNKIKKLDKFIPGFDVELDEKMSESAVQSISAELNQSPVIDIVPPESKIPVASPPSVQKEESEEKKSRVVISQEETEDAVAALLGESFRGNTLDYMDDVLPEEEPDLEVKLEDPAELLIPEEEAEEMRKAVQSLSSENIDLKPDTPNSDLQIDTDTEEQGEDEKPVTPIKKEVVETKPIKLEIKQEDEKKPLIIKPMEPKVEIQVDFKEEKKSPTIKLEMKEPARSPVITPKTELPPPATPPMKIELQNRSPTVQFPMQPPTITIPNEGNLFIYPQIMVSPRERLPSPRQQPPVSPIAATALSQQQMSPQAATGAQFINVRVQSPSQNIPRTNSQPTTPRSQLSPQHMIIQQRQPTTLSPTGNLVLNNRITIEGNTEGRTLLVERKPFQGQQPPQKQILIPQQPVIIKQQPQQNPHQTPHQQFRIQQHQIIPIAFQQGQRPQVQHIIHKPHFPQQPQSPTIRQQSPQQQNVVIVRHAPIPVPQPTKLPQPQQSTISTIKPVAPTQIPQQTVLIQQTKIPAKIIPPEKEKPKVEEVVENNSSVIKSQSAVTPAPPPKERENVNKVTLPKENESQSKEEGDFWSAKETNMESVIKEATKALTTNPENSKPGVIAEQPKESSKNNEATKQVFPATSAAQPSPAVARTTPVVPTPTVQPPPVQPPPTPTPQLSAASETDDSENTPEMEFAKSTGKHKKLPRNNKKAAPEPPQPEPAGPIKKNATKPAPASRGRKGRPSLKQQASAPVGTVPTAAERKMRSQSATSEHQDVYEFHEDSGEENSTATNGERPRLIVTIKSPGPSKEVSEQEEKDDSSKEDTAHTRKSKRLQGKDRTTIDDTIEDVVRNCLSAGGNLTRRTTRAAAASLAVKSEEPKKSPRNQKKVKDAKAIDATFDSGDEQPVLPKATPVKVVEQPVEEPTPPPPKVEEKKPTEPVSILDPKTGVLSFMGQQPPQEQPPKIEEPSTPVSVVVSTPSVSVVPEVKTTVKLPPKAARIVQQQQQQQQQQPPQPLPPQPQPQQVQPLPPKPTPPPQSHPIVIQTPQQAQQPMQTVSKHPLKAHMLNSQKLQQQPPQQQIPTPQPTVVKPPIQVEQHPMVVPKIQQPPVVSVHQKVVQHPPHNLGLPMTAPNLVVHIPPANSPHGSIPSPRMQGQGPSPQQQTQPQQSLKIPPHQAQMMTAMHGQQSPQMQQQTQQHQQLVKQHQQQVIMHQIQKQTVYVQQPPKQQIPNPQPPQMMKQQVHMPIPPHLLQQGPHTQTKQPSVGVSVVSHQLPPNKQVVRLTEMQQKVQQKPQIPDQTGIVVPTMKPQQQPPPLIGKQVVHPPHHSPHMLTGAVASPPLKMHMTSQQPIGQGARTAPPPMSSPQGQPRTHIQQQGLTVPPYEMNMLETMGKYNSICSQSPPPAHQQASPGEGSFLPRNVSREQYFMYQDYVRNQASRIPYIPRSPHLPGTEKEIAELDDAVRPSPPLELRRPGSGPPRPIVAVHPILQSPQDRATDSPQVAQIYLHGARIPHSNFGEFYDIRGLPIAEPPPAHMPLPAQPTYAPPQSSPGAPLAHLNLREQREREERERERLERERLEREERELREREQERMAIVAQDKAVGYRKIYKNMNIPLSYSPTSPVQHTLPTLLQRYPVMWQGLLALKTEQAAVQMHFVFGNTSVARGSLPCNEDGTTPPLRIAQRMRLEPAQLDGVAKKINLENEHCMLLALPCGRDHNDVLQQSQNLKNGFITYLQQKMAAGIINIPLPGNDLTAAYVVHVFPSCEFSNENLERAAPDLKNRVAEIAHLLIVIATV
ncbi:hypothetical protein ACFFRR_004235 [Megaselia abdita]